LSSTLELPPSQDEASLWHAPGGLREAFVTAVPLMISMMSTTVMMFVDRLFLLQYSPEAVAASLPAGIFAFSVICFPLGVASYVSTFVAQYYGAERHHEIGPKVWQGVWIGVASVPLARAFIPLATYSFGLMKISDSMRGMQIDYFVSLSFSGGTHVLAGALAAFFSGRGKTRVVMCVDAFAALLNIGLDYCWIFGKFGFPEWGIAGAGWATTVALWIKVAIYFALFLRRKEREAYGTWSGRRFDRVVTLRLFKYGAVSGVQMMLEVFAFGWFTQLIAALGETASAATALAFNVNNFAFMPIWGVGIATSTMVGRRLGEDRPDLAVRSTWSCLFWGMAYMGAMCVLYVAVPDAVLAPYGYFNESDDYRLLHETLVMLLRFLAAFGLLDALNVILSGTLKGAGDVRYVLVSSIAIAVICVTATWLGIEAGGDLTYCWWVLTAWVAALGAAFAWRFYRGQWKSCRVIEPEVE
jgi:MATE family multidrug resistance protein